MTIQNTLQRTSSQTTGTHPRISELQFRPLTLADVPLINSLIQDTTSRTCDYTAGGIFMWVRAFAYEYCVVDDTLFIKGVSESDPSVTAFMLPAGALPLQRSVAMVQRYCREHGLPVVFSAVPEDRLDALLSVSSDARYEVLGDWSDYLYDIHALASLTGKKLNKKRNHVNRFMAEHPQAVLEPLSARNMSEAMLFMRRNTAADSGADYRQADSEEYEAGECMKVLENWNVYPFFGALLRTRPGGPVAALTAAEVVGDTLFVHIEKMDHEVAGAGETINRMFAALMLLRHPGLRYVNREEDCGDPGLRYAKESYHPVRLLHKYNVYL